MITLKSITSKKYRYISGYKSIQEKNTRNFVKNPGIGGNDPIFNNRINK